ncbi:MAG: hypothetical protein JKX84_07105 [Flavobacteriales bacterium]|nr:hypothetical protein [Flavobacteriales bacterium]
MAKQIETKRVETVIVKEDETLTAEAGKATPSNKLIHQKSGKSKTERTKSGFTGLDFKRWVRNAKNGIRADRSPRVSSSWMSWVSFGTGIGSMAFGLMAILFAILLASSYFIWPALILAGAAITFAVLYKSQNGTDPKAKLGMLFGIIGGGLAFIALIVWAIWLATAFRGVL